jgi:integrative and conjugative element protein (TIGR02256 family)
MTTNEIHIYPSELQAILQELRRTPDFETGGNLYGTFTHGSNAVVWLASGPGPRAVHSRLSFRQDAEFVTHWERVLFDRFGLQYLGNWHSHPYQMDSVTPSSGDLSAIRRYSDARRRDNFIQVITSIDTGGDIKLSAYSVSGLNMLNNTVHEIQVRFLDTPVSPIRAVTETDLERFSLLRRESFQSLTPLRHNVNRG